MRGQAFVIFKDIENAKNAKADLSGHVLYNKEMRIKFAKAKSDLVAKKEGTYEHKERMGYECVPITRKEKRVDTLAKEGNSLSVINTKKVETQSQIVPHKTLFVEELPKITTDHLIQIFQQYPGFKEVRYFAPMKVAFIEFEDEFQAGIA